MAGTMTTVDARGLHYRDLNQRLLELVRQGQRHLRVENVLGQRYIGTGLPPAGLELQGTPGEDLAAFMDGSIIRVFGNVQNAVGNTMNSGRVIVHGSAGDVLGHSMRGGEIWIRGNAGYRVGIHMKASASSSPAIVVGGTAGDFLGEYMAGGTLVVLGLGCEGSERLIGNWIGTGMHGGAIFIRGGVQDYRLGRGATRADCDAADLALLSRQVVLYCEEFGLDPQEVLSAPFAKLTPVTSRPYHRLYASSVGEL